MDDKITCRKCGKIFDKIYKDPWPEKIELDEGKSEFWFGGFNYELCFSCRKKLREIIKNFIILEEKI